MKSNKSLEKFVKMREALVEEKAAIEARLQEINAALGKPELPAAAAQPVRRGPGRPPKAAAKGGPRRGWKRLPNPMSLREAVVKVTTGNPMTKEEILAAVGKLGYQFATSNPINRLGVLLYGKNPKFKNNSGKFSPA